MREFFYGIAIGWVITLLQVLFFGRYPVNPGGRGY
jgi:hypothetical protein